MTKAAVPQAFTAFPEHQKYRWTSGPHDFAVRISVVRLACRKPLTGINPPCDAIAHPTLPRPPHPASRI